MTNTPRRDKNGHLTDESGKLIFDPECRRCDAPHSEFVREGKDAGFGDDQIEFLWEWIHEAITNPEAFTHEDNYSKK